MLQLVRSRPGEPVTDDFLSPIGTPIVVDTDSGKARLLWGAENVATINNVVSAGDWTNVRADPVKFQDAIDTAYAEGAALSIPRGVYDTDIVGLDLQNGVHYFGEGKDASFAKSTAIKYSGVGSAIRVPTTDGNSPGIANVRISDIAIKCLVKHQYSACILATGCTYFWIDGVLVYGNDYGIILEACELTSVRRSQIENGSIGTAGIWIPNGNRPGGGTATFLANRIDIEESNQFSGTVGIGIADDGGISRRICGNNFNAIDTHIRTCNVSGVTNITGNESENAAVANIEFAATTHLGAASSGTQSAVVMGNDLKNPNGKPTITFGANSLVSFTNIGNVHESDAAPLKDLATGVTTTVGFNNKQLGTGSAEVGNTISKNAIYTSAVTYSGGGGNLGVGGSITAYETRGGHTSTVSFLILWGAGMAAGVGDLEILLPRAHAGSIPCMGSWGGAIAGANSHGGSVRVNGTTKANLRDIGVAGFVGAASGLAAGDFVTGTITYEVSSTS